MSSGERTAFSLAWVVAAYLMVCGGIVLALTVVAVADAWTRVAVWAAIGGGAAIGGLFAGRASPHRSFVEPALAGALVIGSLVLLVWRSAVGQLAFAFARDAIIREALIAG